MNFENARSRVARAVTRFARHGFVVGSVLGALLTVASFVNKGFGIGTIVLGAAACYMLSGISVGLLAGVVIGRTSSLSLRELEEWGAREIAPSISAIEQESGLYKLRCPRCNTLCDTVELDDIERTADSECDRCGFYFEVTGGDPEPEDAAPEP